MKNGVDEYRTEQKTSKYMHAYASQNACANMIVRVLDHDIKWTYWSLARSPHICVSFRLNRQGWVERKLWEGHANKAGDLVLLKSAAAPHSPRAIHDAMN